MKFIGITGTNGKTTITYLLSTILNEAGYKTFVSGTLNNRLTTPSPWDLQNLIAKARKQKSDFFIMEVSSHGIHQDRIKGILFYAKLLTNITQDHLDYHKTFRAYKKVKMDWMKKGPGIKIYPRDYQKAVLPKGPVPLLGDFNELNLKGAVSLCRALGVDEKVIARAMKKIKPVPGRFENIPNKKNFKVIVDYAHTPDGLKNVLSTCTRLRNGSGGKLITVFGCGGDRDRGKRPKMAAVVEKLSDYFIVTSDNPRTEKPAQIFEDIQKGIRGKKEYEVIEDRRHAIEKAIRTAKSHDIVLLAGKGHETYQIIGKKRIHFDDREEARKALSQSLKNG